MSDYTAQELLEAVGIIPDAEPGWLQWRLFTNFGTEYTGPDLGTPELDAILLVEGQRWCVSNSTKTTKVHFALESIVNNEWPEVVVLYDHPTPGHALARAIKEVKK